MRLYDSVVMQSCGYAVMWLYGHVVMRSRGYTFMWLYVYVVIRLCGYTIMWLYGYVVMYDFRRALMTRLVSRTALRTRVSGDR